MTENELLRWILAGNLSFYSAAIIVWVRVENRIAKLETLIRARKNRDI